MNLRRAFALVVLAMAGALVLIPTTPSLASPAQAQTSCKHIKLSVAIDTFKHVDGTPSLRSEWTTAGDQALFYQGATIQGTVPQDFYVIGSGLFRYYEGSSFEEDYLTLVCLPDPGTNHTPYPPQHCPINPDEAVAQIGGIALYWSVNETDTYVTLNYFLAGAPLGSGTVPRQGVGRDNHNATIDIGPGYRFPMTDAFTLTCWKEAAPTIEPSASPAPIAVGLTSFGGSASAHTRKIGPELTLSIPVVISRYKKCDLPSYMPELMAARTATLSSNWHIIRKCMISYDGETIPRFLDLQKDEAAWMCGCDNVVLQYPQHFARSNSFVIRFYTSKAGYFSTAKTAHLKQREVMDYYSHNQGVWAPFPNGMMRYSGPYQVFIVDSNHLVCAYGARWTSGYVVGSSDFTVIPDYLLIQGVRCGKDGNVIYH